MNTCRFCILFLLGLFVLSCATAGKKIDMQAVNDNIKIGESSREDVLKVCGEPLTKRFDIRNGLEIWHYASVEKNITGRGIVSNIFGYGEEWKTNTVVMDIYITNGIVSDVRTETSDRLDFNRSYQ